MTAVLLGLALVVGAVGFVVLVRFERQGRSHVGVLLVFALLAVEGALYPRFEQMPTSLFHPSFGELNFHVFEVLIPLLLAARLVARGGPRTVGASSLLWLAFLAWYATSALLGWLQGNDVDEIWFQARAIVYVGGGFALAAGASAALLADPARGLVRLVRPMALLAGLLAVTESIGIDIDLDLPLLPLEELGDVAADTASVFGAFAFVAVAWRAALRDRSVALALAPAPLVVVAVLTEQRAALLALATSAVVVAAAFCLPAARRRVSMTGTDVAITVLAVVAVLLVQALGTAVVRGDEPEVPLAGAVTDAFESRSKAMSAQARINQWRAFPPLISEQPIMGWGLGVEFQYFLPGENRVVNSAIAHNIGADLWLRSGLVGLLLFLLAAASTVRDGFLAWRHHAERVGAVMGLVGSAVVVGLLAKAMVESTLENHRLAILVGMFLGIARVARTSYEGAASPTDTLVRLRPSRVSDRELTWN